MRKLTARQRAVLDWVVGFVRKHSLPPTLREIGKAFRISSPGVLGHLRALERKGYVKRGKLGARSLEITGMPVRSTDDSVELPMVGPFSLSRTSKERSGSTGGCSAAEAASTSRSASPAIA